MTQKTAPRERAASKVLTREISVFETICESVDTPRSLACYLMAKYSCWDDYLSLPAVDWDISENPEDDYLVSSIMSKNPLIPTTFNRLERAKSKWYGAEESCSQTNLYFRAYQDGRCSLLKSALVERARGYIAHVLGRLSRADLDYCEGEFRFGPGATSTVKGRDVLLSKKMTSRWDVTPGLYPYWRSIVPTVGGKAMCREIGLKAYSDVIFVPKSAKIDRAIAIEPHGNIFVQLGIGALIRRKLLRVGVDLNTQADRNRLMAQKAYKLGLATIDLSSASDTVSLELVRTLLPIDWVALLETARCEYSMIDGTEVRLEKFSSMGNGYTFELETLIFMSVCYASGCEVFDVFGDDIIVPQTAAKAVISHLEFFGFTVNEEKTFLAGKFFESCGTDWYRGLNIRPFFLKGKYETSHHQSVRMANAISFYSQRRGLGYYRDRRFLRAWVTSLKGDKLAQKTSVPFGYDNGVMRSFDDATPSMLPHGHQGYYGTVLSIKPVYSRRTDLIGAYAAALAWGTPHDTRARENERGSLGSLAVKSCVFPTWDSPGPWLS